ncbi:MAG: thermonuclease family protein [Gammaproteobacteria bacterium]|nr:thermonuclease family protein [Gammaproteobacteria bacterium]
MKIRFLNKKVLLSTFFYACLLLPFTAIITSPETVGASTVFSNCPDISYKKSTKNIKTAFVHHITDGDTLVLTDGKKVRLLGINTPEVDFNKLEQSQPLGISARNRLQELLPDGTQVTLIFDQRKKDRYKRLLAFVRYTNNEGVEIDTGEVLLKEGLAWQYVILPNQLCWKNYRQAETKAYEKQTGVWNKRNYQTERAATTFLSDQKRQYKRLSGTVTAIEHSSKNFWFIIDDIIWFGIARKDANYFADEIENIKKGTSLQVSGWMYRSYEKLRIKARHPQAIRILLN